MRGRWRYIRAAVLFGRPASSQHQEEQQNQQLVKQQTASTLPQEIIIHILFPLIRHGSAQNQPINPITQSTVVSGSAS
jgi:hypothetical protein